MGYQIAYPGEKYKMSRRPPDRRLRRRMTALWFLIFLVTVCFFWQEGREVLRKILIPGDPEMTVAAVETMAEDISRGLPLKEAAAAFCRTVLANGPVS